MKKLIYLAIILLGVGILSSCDKIGGGSGDNIIGSWECIYTEDEVNAQIGDVWTFEKGGTLLINKYPLYQWRYYKNEDIYRISGVEIKVLTLTSDKLRFIMHGVATFEFKKVK